MNTEDTTPVQTTEGTVSEDTLRDWSEALLGGEPVVGCSYIGPKVVYRVVTSAWDRAPLCFHKHESGKEALECPEALEAARTKSKA